MRSRTTLTLAAALAVILVSAAPAAAQRGGFFGVGPQGALSTLSDQDYALMEEAGAGSMRFLVSVRNVRQPDGGYNFGSLDRAIGDAAARGIRSFPFLYQRPAPRTQAGRRAFAAVARALAIRYGRGGSFWTGGDYNARHPGKAWLPIRSWQVLNEQNGRAYWGARPAPRLYALALRTTAAAIRRIDRNAEIVFGGMFGTPGGRGSMTSWQYLNRVYRVRGIKRSFNTVSVHPYGRTLRDISRQIRRIRYVMRRNGHRRAGVRVTEIGWGSATGSHPFLRGPQGQARMLRRSFRMLIRNRKRWGIRGVHWFSWEDGKVGCAFCASAGLLQGDQGDRTRKPSFWAFRAIAG